MNSNLLAIVKHITAQYGEDILNDAKRLKALFSDLAKDEPKVERMAFGRCIEEGAYAVLKNAQNPVERASRKAALAERLRDEHGIDLSLCAGALDILEAAIFGEMSAPGKAAPKTSPPAAPAVAAPPERAAQSQPQTPPAPAIKIHPLRLILIGRKVSPQRFWLFIFYLLCFMMVLLCLVDTINNNDGFGIVVFLIILSVLELILSAILGFALYDFTWTRVNAERLIADYTEAIRLDPNNVELYYERAKVYSNKNDYTQAIADYTEAIRLDPNYMPAYLNRGSVHEEKKDYNRAIADYTEAVRLAPKDKDCKLSLKNARKKRGW